MTFEDAKKAAKIILEKKEKALSDFILENHQMVAKYEKLVAEVRTAYTDYYSSATDDLV
ncbi:MAG: hypothetical protein ACXAEU_22915 [Candidatus Hodarchaeales archaeon]